jgi:hypothetical protein
MSTYTYERPTNDKPNSQVDVTGYLMPARAFFFMVVEEPGRDGFLVRRCYTTMDSPYLQELKLSPLQMAREMAPEKFGLWARDLQSTASIAEHVMGYEKLSSFVSTSSQFPSGATRFTGKTVFIDIAKAKRAGATLVSTSEITSALEQYAKENPHVAKRVAKINNYVKNIDHEVLIQPRPNVPAPAAFTEGSLARTLGIVKYARVVEVFGVVFTAYDLGVAADQSFHAKSVQPIAKEVVRQTGGWGGAVLGARMGSAAGVLVGLETGPGALITGLIGGLVFGSIGYFGGRMVADSMPDK